VSNRYPDRFARITCWSRAFDTHTDCFQQSIPVSDIILLQEPWYGRIGIDHISGNDIRGPCSHPDWLAILPPVPPDGRPYVMAYVRKDHPGWRVSNRTDLISRPDAMALEITSDRSTTTLINIYNPADNSVTPLIPSLRLHGKVIITGDFNLHHPMWSSDGKAPSPGADELVDFLLTSRYSLLNSKGAPTFFRKDYTSVLDLTWASEDALPQISDWKVMYEWHQGSDHYPICFSLTITPFTTDFNSNLPAFTFKDDAADTWQRAFMTGFRRSWKWDDIIEGEDIFDEAVSVLSDLLISASQQAAPRKPIRAKAARWFNQEVRKAVKIMRKDCKRDHLFPSPHNSLQYQASLNQVKYEVVRNLHY